VPQAFGQLRELASRALVRRGREGKMREWIPCDAVGTALQQDELRREVFQMLQYLAPRGIEGCVIGTRRQRHVEFGTRGRTLAPLEGAACTRIKETPILVDVGEDQLRVALESVVEPITMMGIDVNISDARKTVMAAQPLDGDAAIVQSAESRSATARGVVQSGNRHEGPPRTARHDGLGRRQRRADDIRSDLEHAIECRGIAPVEVALAAGRATADIGEIIRLVKELEFLERRHASALDRAASRETTPLELAQERALAICPPRVTVGKAVAGEPLIGDHENLGHDAIEPSTGHNACPFFHPLRPHITRMAQYIYTMNRVGKIVPPKRQILRDISLSFFPGAKIGVLGLNGSGKSTLLKIMAGLDTNIEGEARPQPNIKVGYLPQEPELDPNKTVREEVIQGIGGMFAKLERFNAISEQFAEPMSDDEMNKLLEEQAKLQDEIDAAGGWELDRKLEIAADALRLPPWDSKIDLLSGGEKRRVALCRLLLSAPDMLLLDEPTNHLDAESIAWLEKYLEEYPSTVIAVTHDRYFLDNVAEWILELDRGHGIPYHGNYSSWLEQKEKRLAQEEREREALRKTLERELEWVRQNPKARQAKSKARMQRYEELASREFQERNETNEIYIPPGERLGDLVIEAKGLRKSFGDRLLIDNLNFNLPPGGIVGIIGPNGAGKTTLFRMLTGAEKPDAGEIRIGSTVKLAYVDQSRQALNDKNSVWQEISNGLELIKVGNYETSSRGYVGRFNFKGTQQQQSIGELSGGERNRVHLAKVLKSGGNVLLLDEPTNDLDVETLRALEEGLLAYPGCAVVISHDRWFLDRIATHILAFEGNSEVVWFEGNYQEYVEDYRKRRGEDANQPHRIRYKPLVR
jgi:sulfate-transporting ATPase